MSNNKLLTCLVSFMLCTVIIFNCNMYRRDTYAFAAVAVYGIEFTAEAAAAIAGLLYAYGLVSSDPTDNVDVFSVFTGYDTGIDIDSLAEQDTANKQAYVDKCNAKYNSVGLYYTLGDNGVITCSTLGNRQVGVVEQWATTTTADILTKASTTIIDNADIIYDAGALVSTTVNGAQRVYGGISAAAAAVSSIGSDIYDWLHSADDVSYDAGFDAQVITDVDTLRAYIYDNYVASVLSSYVSDFSDSCPLGSAYLGMRTDCTYIDLWQYLDYTYCDKYSSEYVVGPTVKLGYVLYNDYSSTAYYCYNVFRFWDPNGKCDYTFQSSTVPPISCSNYTTAYDKVCSKLGVESPSYVFHGAISADGSDVDAVTGAASITIGDATFDVADDNIYTKKEAVLTGIDDATAADGTTIVTVPAVDTDGTYVQPKGIASIDTAGNVVYDDVQTLVNPDVVDSIDTDTAISDADYVSQNIFQLLYKFFNNFWAKLKQVLAGLFTVDAAFLLAWVDKFKAAFDAKGYDFNFNWLNNGDLQQIPDFYIKWGGKEYLFIKSDYIYSCVDFVRSVIRAYIYLLILLHDRLRFLALVRGVNPDNVLPDTVDNGI